MPRRFRSASVCLVLAALAPSFAGTDLHQRTGKYDVILRLPPEGLTARRETPIAIRIEDADGNTVGSDARVHVSIDMPAMPGMPPLDAVARAVAPPDYEIRPVFAHGGEYRMKVMITLRGSAPFPVEFRLKVLDIAGRRHEPDLMFAAMGPGGDRGGLYSSGTSQEPRAAPHNMLSWRLRDWSLMLHGIGFAVCSDQTGPRGRDKFFSPNWIMTMASRHLGPGTLTLRSMLTLEPLTVTGSRYPLLFQTGETAYGVPIINGQHPHDFFMELAAAYQIRLSDRTAINLYGGPRGDPALGPPAFPHRLSASENPIAAISHHMQDSTHISSNVATAGITHGPVTWEVSGFHGREPDEKRWGIEGGAIDSLATRLTLNPSARWSGQFSIGRINNHEATHPLRDTLRTTASISYVRPLARGHWATTLAWGRNNDLEYTQLPGVPALPRFGQPIALARVFRPQHVVSVPTRIPNQIYNSYLAEATLRLRRSNWAWGRVESVDKDSTLLFEEAPLVLLVDERRFARVQLYTAGYGRELRGLGCCLSPALGSQITVFHAPPSLAPVYGANSLGLQVFLRLRLAVPSN